MYKPNTSRCQRASDHQERRHGAALRVRAGPQRDRGIIVEPRRRAGVQDGVREDAADEGREGGTPRNRQDARRRR